MGRRGRYLAWVPGYHYGRRIVPRDPRPPEESGLQRSNIMRVRTHDPISGKHKNDATNSISDVRCLPHAWCFTPISFLSLVFTRIQITLSLLLRRMQSVEMRGSTSQPVLIASFTLQEGPRAQSHSCMDQSHL